MDICGLNMRRWEVWDYIDCTYVNLQEEENELDALQSAKELEEEKKRAKEQQAKMVL